MCSQEVCRRLHRRIRKQRVLGRHPHAAASRGVQHAQRRQARKGAAHAPRPGLAGHGRRPERIHRLGLRAGYGRRSFQQARIGRRCDVRKQASVPVGAHLACASEVIAEPHIATVGGQLEEGVHVHRQACAHGKRQEAEGKAFLWSQRSVGDAGGHGSPRHQAHAVLRRASGSQRRRAPTAERLADEVGFQTGLLAARAVRPGAAEGNAVAAVHQLAAVGGGCEARERRAVVAQRGGVLCGGGEAQHRRVGAGQPLQQLHALHAAQEEEVAHRLRLKVLQDGAKRLRRVRLGRHVSEAPAGAALHATCSHLLGQPAARRLLHGAQREAKQRARERRAHIAAKRLVRRELVRVLRRHGVRDEVDALARVGRRDVGQVLRALGRQ